MCECEVGPAQCEPGTHRGRGEGCKFAPPPYLYIDPPHRFHPTNVLVQSRTKGKPVLTTEQITKLYDNYINTAIGTWDDILEKLRDDPEFSQLVEEGNYIEVVLEVLSPC